MIDVAVGICAYNEELAIAKSIRSIFAQKLEEVSVKEVVVVASGCTDGTVSIVRGLMQEYPLIQLIVQEEREGKNSAINAYLDRMTCGIAVMLNADNVFATDDSLEKLVLPFKDPAVGITGGRPVPLNGKKDQIGYTVNMMWLMHHHLAMIYPKIGEIIAFRDIGTRLRTDQQSDEDILRMRLEEAGYKCLYVPECIVYNRGPETREDFIKQRVRVDVGEVNMKKYYDYDIPTWDNRLLFKSFVMSFWELGFHPVKTIRAVNLERYCRRTAIRHVKDHKDSMACWDQVGSTKRLRYAILSICWAGPSCGDYVL